MAADKLPETGFAARQFAIGRFFFLTFFLRSGIYMHTIQMSHIKRQNSVSSPSIEMKKTRWRQSVGFSPATVG